MRLLKQNSRNLIFDQEGKFSAAVNSAAKLFGHGNHRDSGSDDFEI